MHYVFFRTTDVFAVEEILTSLAFEIEVVPTPVQDKAYCGICIKVSEKKEGIKEIISNFEYIIID
jgi:hypothetical protein